MNKRRLFISLTILLILLIVGITYLVSPASIQAEWDKSPRNLVISIQYAGEVDANYIPAVQIWGDGHIIWVEHDVAGQRYVWGGNLSQDELTQIVDRIIGAGFFKDYERFGWPNDVYLGDHLQVNLLSARHWVFIEKADKAIRDIANFLRAGAGVTGTEFLPAGGSLEIYTLEDLRLPADTAALHQWPDEEFGYSLEDVLTGGRTKTLTSEDDELLVAWKITNNPSPLVESSGKVYWLAFRPNFTR